MTTAVVRCLPRPHCVNAPAKRDVLGTLMPGLVAGHRRYAHITALRGDAVAAQALGMRRIVSEDALRRALERIDESRARRGRARRCRTTARAVKRRI